MKTKSSSFMSLFLLFSLVYFGECHAQSFVEGNWIAKCVLEKTSESSMTFNSLCQYDKIDQASIRFIEFELNIDNQVLKIQEDDKYSSMDYSFDEGTNILAFKYKDEDFKFSVLVVNGSVNLLLKDESGTLVYLEKKI